MARSDVALENGSTSSEHLTIRAYRLEGRRTLVLTGELDLRSAPKFEDMVVRACAEGTSELVLELSRLEYIDAKGLDAVLSTKTVCARNGCAFFLTPEQCSDRRAFELLRRAHYLPFRRSRGMKPAKRGRAHRVGMSAEA